MSRLPKIPLLALLLCSALAQTAPAAGMPLSVPPLLAEARRELGLLHVSDYRHQTDVNEAAGRFDYDCSGFIDYALRHVAPGAYAELPIQRASSPRPLAQDYYALFAGLHTPSAHWQAVATVQALRPGDLVTWLKPPDHDTHNTGHIMLVRSPPYPNPADPAEWLIPVTDSTATPHAQDTRTGQHRTGLGSGLIGVLADAQGHAVAYHWKGGVSHRTETPPIAFGRLIAAD